ncbi:MAG: shikimate kinase [Chlorobi bacterium]|nr:shikimate kinase [Chlorobiota bacterium]
MSLIYLIGFMGVGKSTIGKKLAKELGYDFVDLDDLFESRYKLNIAAFFGKYGEELFRELENKILLETFSYKNTVIATGGGTPCFYGAIDGINKNGISIYLKMPVGALVKRLENAIRPRPFAFGKSHDELLEDVGELLQKREADYLKANFKHDASKPDLEPVIEFIELCNKQ